MGRVSLLRGLAASATVLFALSGCGGGDGGSSTPAPTNGPPAFTSATTSSVPENSAQPFYTLAATDPDGDTVSFSISGGADASAFTLSGTNLAFASPRNFDQPTDADLDNTYQVVLTAQDSKGGSANLSLTVEVSNDREGVSVSRFATGLGTDAVITARTDGATGLIAISQDGTVREFYDDSGAAILSGNVFKNGEAGRVLAVAHFNRYGVAMLDIAGLGVVVRAFSLQDNQLPYVAEDVLATASTDRPRGTLFIGGNGFLFGAVGDPSDQFAQDANSGFGKFYRVQVDPYCGASLHTYCVYGEQFGGGIHAPAGGGAYASRSFLLDSGTDRQEEINYFNQNSNPFDFGWPYREGTHVRTANPPSVVNGPSLTYSYGDGFFEGQGMTGGVYYSGSIQSLDDRILITDRAGKVFSFPAGFLSDTKLHTSQEMENRTADFKPSSGTLERPVAIVRNSAGQIYILDGDGELYVVG